MPSGNPATQATSGNGLQEEMACPVNQNTLPHVFGSITTSLLTHEL